MSRHSNDSMEHHGGSRIAGKTFNISRDLDPDSAGYSTQSEGDRQNSAQYSMLNGATYVEVSTILMVVDRDRRRDFAAF